MDLGKRNRKKMNNTEEKDECIIGENKTEQRKEFTISATDKLPLACALFPCADPKGVIQMIHGAKEHKERYYGFCEFLQRNGYAVLISDIRGHGASLNEKYTLGYMDGLALLIQDQRILTMYLQETYPGVPLHLFGHSFGSLIARKYMQKYDAQLASVTMSGTANYVKVVKPGMAYGKLMMKFDGERGHHPFMMSLGDKDDDAWLAYNPKVQEVYRKDPLCSGYKYTNRAVLTVWEADRELKNYKAYECRNPKLPILSVTGVDDEVAGFEKGLKDSVKNLRRVGYEKVNTIVYPNMKHEVLNEVGNEKVYEDVLRFLDGTKEG